MTGLAYTRAQLQAMDAEAIVGLLIHVAGENNEMDRREALREVRAEVLRRLKARGSP